MYAIYKSYQDLLRLAHKYDTDDIVISAYRSISTPILERKREVTGYDLCVDSSNKSPTALVEEIVSSLM